MKSRTTLLLAVFVAACGGQPPSDNRGNAPAPPRKPDIQPPPVAQPESSATGRGSVARRAPCATNGRWGPAGDADDPDRMTDANGRFVFDNLAAGNCLSLQIPAGFERTTDQSFVVTVTADRQAEARFGIAPLLR